MYSAQITRANPTCVVLLIDGSRSMASPFGGSGMERKADFVADVVNHTLHDLVIRCTKTEEIRDYYYVSIISYSGRGVGSAFVGALSGRGLTRISEVAEYPARIERRIKRVPDGRGGFIEQTARIPVWVDPLADGETPMCAGFALAKQQLAEWLTEHRRGYPPTVLHLTDGESSDGDPTELGREV